MQFFRKLNVEDNTQDQQKGLQKLSLLVQKNNSHLKGVGFIERKHRQINTITDNLRVAKQAQFRGQRCKDEIIENTRSVTQYNQSFFSNSSQYNSPLTTRVNSPTQQSEANFLDYFVLGSIDQSYHDKRSHHKQSKSAVNPKLTQNFGTSAITEQLSLVSQEQFKLVNQSSEKLNKFFFNQIEIQKKQSIQKDLEYTQILQKSAQINGLVNHSIIYNQTPLKMMLFKDSVEYYKLECKNKQLPLRIHCTDLSAPFLLAISAINKYPKPNSHAHEYLIQFDGSGSKKLEFQSLQRYITNPNHEPTQSIQTHQNSCSLDNKIQNPNKMIFSQTKTQWIYFSFIGQQFSSFTITTEFQDDISFKFFNEEIFKPQKHIPQKQVNKMIQAKNEKYMSLAQLQKFNQETLQIIKRRKQETLKKSNNIDIVELNKSRAKLFLNLEYEKFLNKVNKVQDRQIQKVKEQQVMKEEEKQNEIQLKIQIKEYVKKQMQEARKLQYKQQQLIQFRKRWIQLIILNKLIMNIMYTLKVNIFQQNLNQLILFQKYKLVQKFYRKERLFAIKIIEQHKKKIQMQDTNLQQRLMIQIQNSLKLFGSTVKQFSVQKATEIVKLTLLNMESFKIMNNIFTKSQIQYDKCKRLQIFIKTQYKSENEKAMNLLLTLFQEIRMNKKVAAQKNEEQSTTSVFSQLNSSVVLSLVYFLQQFTEETKKKICKQYITLRKQIFRQQYKKHNELLEDFQVKLDQYKQKIQMLAEYKNNMLKSPEMVSKNWSNIRKISLAVSLFSGNQSHKKQTDLDKSQIEQTSPLIRQKTSSFASSQSQLNSYEIEQNRKKNLNTPRNSSKYSNSNSPQSNKNQKDDFNFNNAFESYEQSQIQVKQMPSPSPLTNIKQKMSLRNSLFSPQNKLMEEKIEEPKFTSKRPKLNLESRKEMEDILLSYLMQQKEKNM
ncbi:hypothetical protein ABPG72_018711 [Tetrahymena utriculariae]